MCWRVLAWWEGVGVWCQRVLGLLVGRCVKRVHMQPHTQTRPVVLTCCLLMWGPMTALPLVSPQPLTHASAFLHP